jgi:hypothetical protein
LFAKMRCPDSKSGSSTELGEESGVIEYHTV